MLQHLLYEKTSWSCMIGLREDREQVVRTSNLLSHIYIHGIWDKNDQDIVVHETVLKKATAITRPTSRSIIH